MSARLLSLLPVTALLLLPLRAHAADPPRIDFNRDIRPILSNNCFACHGPDEKVRKADLRLDTRTGATESAIVPGKPEASELLKRVTIRDADMAMPPAKSGKKLTPREVQLLTQWVKEGAQYSEHWAYVKPVRPAIPKLSTEYSVLRNPIDAFVISRLDKEGLKPSPEADRYALIRRVSLDLTGLPPTVPEVDAFIKDTTPDAYEKLVDKLLAKPAFGEHWARLWLDLARYADSAGYADDPPRTIWKYRDYVIKSLNDNKRFDQFTIEQIAGDLLPNATEEQLVATAFHRNTMTNNEGGTNDEEFRNVAVVDRVNTTLTVWMGTSIACCQCHNHKYDPITQKEFFQLFAFLNNTADADRSDESPTLPFWTSELLARQKELQDKVAALEVILKQAKPDALKVDRDLLVALKKQLADVKPVTTVPIMNELPVGQRRKTRIQFRGNFLDLGDEVTEGVPAVFHSMPKDSAKDRLSLARWLVSPENPLTARVVANRLWEQLFGVGIVRTSEEFGTQGELPSHPELLDWLAFEFMNHGWSIKWLHRQIMLSRVYQLASDPEPLAVSRDAANIYLWRANRHRLDIEAWRDSLLCISGNLDPAMGGPTYDLKDPNAKRRTVYAKVSRHELDGLLRLFDFPDANVTADRRNTTTVPQQQLFALNSEFMVIQAKAFAARVEKAASDDEQRVKTAYRLAFTRDPDPRELRLAVAFLKLPARPDDKLTRWQQYCQALLASNEMMYVD
jgi:hypothetical protein